MIRVTKTFTKPNATITWATSVASAPLAAFFAYRDATYGKKMANQTDALSADKLTWIHTTDWLSQADWDAFRADPQTQAGLAIMRNYNSSMGITETTSSQEV
jgi:hypothetical protein